MIRLRTLPITSGATKMPKGRGSNEARVTRRLKDRKGGGTQSGRLKKDSMQIISSRVDRPKYSPVDLEGVMDETATLLEKLRKRFRRKQR